MRERSEKTVPLFMALAIVLALGFGYLQVLVLKGNDSETKVETAHTPGN